MLQEWFISEHNSFEHSQYKQKKLEFAALIPIINAINFQSPEKKSSTGQMVFSWSLYPSFISSNSLINWDTANDKYSYFSFPIYKRMLKK